MGGVQSLGIFPHFFYLFWLFYYFTLFMGITLFIISLDSRHLKEGDNDNDKGKGTGRSGRDSPEDLQVMA